MNSFLREFGNRLLSSRENSQSPSSIIARMIANSPRFTRLLNILSISSKDINLRCLRTTNLSLYLSQKTEKASPRQRRKLGFTSQFTSIVEHVPGIENVVADALSRVDLIRLPMDLELPEFVKEQLSDPELTELLKSSTHSLALKCIEFSHNHNKVYCDLTGRILRPYIPKSLRRQVFERFHSPSHPGVKVTDHLIRQRYTWSNMDKDVKVWCNGCLDCQQSKISRYMKNEPLQFVAPDDRFRHIHIDVVGPLKRVMGSRISLRSSIVFRVGRRRCPLETSPQIQCL